MKAKELIIKLQELKKLENKPIVELLPLGFVTGLVIEKEGNHVH